MSKLPSLKLVDLSASVNHLCDPLDVPSHLTSFSPKSRYVTALEHLWTQIDEDMDMISRSLNASRMWRALRSPAGLDPTTWLEHANPVISGLATYFEKLKITKTKFADVFDVDKIVFAQGEEPEGRCSHPGDVMFTFVLAYAYASALDAQVESTSQSVSQG